MRVLFIYESCSLGGVEITIINKMKLMELCGIYSEAILVFNWTEGGQYILRYPRIKAGLTKEEIIQEIKKNYDIITVIDYPDFFSLLEGLDISSKIIYETHNSILTELDKSYSIINHSLISTVIVPSQFNKEMINKLTIHSKNIEILYNPIDTRLFKNIPLSGISSEYRKFKNKINIIWIGRLQQDKNPIEMIRIGNYLLGRRKNLHFIMVGDTCQDTEYLSSIKSSIPKKYKSRYTFFEFVSNEMMPELYSLAANTGGCLVSTSNFESLPMVLVEAMACKCPVVSSGVGGIRELIENNETGILYKLHDIYGGVMAIDKLIRKRDNKLRDNIVNNAMSIINDRHSFQKVSEAYIKILSDILKEGEKSDFINAIQNDNKSSVLDASIIIPSFNRKYLLFLSLNSFNNQSYDMNKFEVIVIDDGSIDGTYEMLKELETKYCLKILTNENRKGAAAARNQGAAIAKGSIIIFSDSDCLVPENFVGGHINYHKQNNKLAVCAVISWKKAFTMYFTEFNEEQKNEFKNALTSIPKFKQRIEDIDFCYLGNTKMIFESDISDIEQYCYIPDWSNYFLIEVLKAYGSSLKNFQYPWTFFGTGNASIDKSVFYEVGGFDESLPREEDWDLGYRLYKNGINLIAAPELESIHQEHPIQDCLEQVTIESYRGIFNKYNDPILKMFCLYNEGVTDLISLSKAAEQYKSVIQNNQKLRIVEEKFIKLLQIRVDAYLEQKKKTNKFYNIYNELSMLTNYKNELQNYIQLFRELSIIFEDR